MNELQRRLGPQGLVVVGFPCNQFGHQEKAKKEEILNSLKYVRPGGGFEPNFMLFEKCEVNGAESHPLFTFLREALPVPSDDATALMTNPKHITWSLRYAETMLHGTLRSSWWSLMVFLCAGTAATSRPLTSKPCCPKGPAVPRAPLLPQPPGSCSAALWGIFIYEGVSSKPIRSNT
ncbi:hypothetical protein P7K49_016693 [Saguinus oedipus]|uniref:Glutathione peroxidase 1 n=1 Tax=Saguinus oedipus TaxID=9490 RepID=A0ABQ9VCU4_SAGOE|nr:hypothetical protein P7K49_016693 [Saguinus oedipus]